MIDKIINEWTYQLDSGYPTKNSDYEILRSVLREMKMLSEQEIDRTILQAKGLAEADKKEPEYDGSGSDVDIFTQAINNSYISVGQQVENLPALYNYIQKLPEEQQESINELIFSQSPALPLQTGQVQLTGGVKQLYDAILKSGVGVKNGHPSELWFAIVFKGNVAGAVGGKEGIESDVDLDTGEKISLKAYEKASFDFGTLEGEAFSYLKKFEAMSEIVTGVGFQFASMTATDINKALENLSAPEIQNDIRQFLSLDSDVAIIEKVQTQIRFALGNLINATYPESIDRVDEYFCQKIDEFISKKLRTVDFWGFIINKNILYLRDVDTIFNALICRQHPTIPNLKILSPGVSNFKGGKLFVNGGSYNISKVWYDKE